MRTAARARKRGSAAASISITACSAEFRRPIAPVVKTSAAAAHAAQSRNDSDRCCASCQSAHGGCESIAMIGLYQQSHWCIAANSFTLSQLSHQYIRRPPRFAPFSTMIGGWQHEMIRDIPEMSSSMRGLHAGCYAASSIEIDIMLLRRATQSVSVRVLIIEGATSREAVRRNYHEEIKCHLRSGFAVTPSDGGGHAGVSNAFHEYDGQCRDG